MEMQDSGKREQFESGAVRDAAEGKSRPDLQSPYAQDRIGQWLKQGAEKYDERNWEQGMKFSRCIASLERHLVAYKMGKYDEDHLAAIAVNAEFIMHYEEMIDLGVLPDTLDDMPHYVPYEKKVVSSPEPEKGPNEIVPSSPKPEPELELKRGDEVRIKLRDDAPEGLKNVFDSLGGTFLFASWRIKNAGVVLVNGGQRHLFHLDELTLVKPEININNYKGDQT